ncbi:altronate dehydratase [Litorivicinus lipolyticus]|uniref:Altronate dehydratase n=1 Tax=Litorivicinus lipolyticus TaxID=418701 RepID=A0A5Q2QEV8_9GAMM|nr:altronate dehydratase family protein [Litorivicinus lipolyticus]QGG79545.1 altronate dehydratase [Litorivicinus lipolyticus]
MSTVQLSPADNVAVATVELCAGDFGAIETIPRGHKLATRPVAQGEPVLKYAQVIGYAACDIAQGAHVHEHNLEFRNVSQIYEFSTRLQDVPKATQADTFMGYRRANGRVGTRNYIAILTSVNCSATAARMIAQHFTPERLADYPNVDGVAAFVHGTGCAMGGDGTGIKFLQRVLWGYAKHPNVGGALIAGLGCETMQIDRLVGHYGLEPGPLFQAMNIQDNGGLQKTIELGIAQVQAMLPLVNQAEREPCPASELMVALQCGGSDAWSGITANPALGYASDLLVAQGGSVVLAETPEIYGAEHLLTARARTETVGGDLIGLIRWWEDYTQRNHGSMDNNPSPGNKKGGLTTILEKSLGAVAKGGTSPLNGVYKYAEPVTTPGFNFMDSPGYDPASVTGQIASGCNLVTFTTGRGSAFGSKPAPTLKIATNTPMFERLSADMDVNAGQVLSDGASVEAVGQQIYQRWLQVASGQATKSEAQGLGDYEFVPWQVGAVM